MNTLLLYFSKTLKINWLLFVKVQKNRVEVCQLKIYFQLTPLFYILPMDFQKPSSFLKLLFTDTYKHKC